MKRLLFIGLLFLCSYSYADECLQDIVVPTKYYTTLVSYCKMYDVPVYYMSRLIAYESGWNINFINYNKDGSKDYSLCQLNSACMYDLIRWHNDGKKFDPMNWDDNLRIGVAHMRFLYDRNRESWWAAVACYNMGETAFRAWCAGSRRITVGTQHELDYVFR